jgi:hypothetical protein
MPAQNHVGLLGIRRFLDCFRLHDAIVAQRSITCIALSPARLA